ncbi:hypothetical protein KY321_00055 [Candidatus Woesearchaeota archaeon]|nr:hypothetical protein [Candidatus Woesearchaeota archaeon]
MKKLLTILLALVLSCSFVLADGHEETEDDFDEKMDAIEEQLDELIERADEKDAKTEKARMQAKERRQENLEERRIRENVRTGEERAQMRESIKQRQNQMQENKAKIDGLKKALEVVKDGNARSKLEGNIDKFQKRVQRKLYMIKEAKVEDVDLQTGKIKIKTKEKVKYLGFIPGSSTKRFEISVDGDIKEEHPWYSFLYAEYDDEPILNQAEEVTE